MARQMSLQTVTCSVCGGSRTLDYFEERVGGAWRKRAKDSTPMAILEDMRETHPDAIRAVPDACWKCDGRGEYEVEYVTCKVY